MFSIKQDNAIASVNYFNIFFRQINAYYIERNLRTSNHHFRKKIFLLYVEYAKKQHFWSLNVSYCSFNFGNSAKAIPSPWSNNFGTLQYTGTILQMLLSFVNSYMLKRLLQPTSTVQICVVNYIFQLLIPLLTSPVCHHLWSISYRNISDMYWVTQILLLVKQVIYQVLERFKKSKLSLKRLWY